ncbi:MAG TPA: PAS-domain containing protein [Stellaceae bacterium]|jgi:signal transduction histidine kinase|nr:PAS-domain containing protein [Stellaceae bacterium]
MMLQLAAGICVVAAVVFFALWQRSRARLRDMAASRVATERERAAAEDMLATVPLAVLRWPPDAAEPMHIGRPGEPGGMPFSSFLHGLDAADGPRLATAMERLKRQGTGFSAAVSTTSGTVYQIEGCTTASGDPVAWLVDVSPIRQAERGRAVASVEAGIRRAVIDALPMPVWRRGHDLRLVDCNRAYAAALDLPREDAIAHASELAPETGLALARAALDGTAQSERRHVVIAGSRRLLDITETPDGASGTIGWALDCTDLEGAEGELLRHVNAHGQVLESIHAAVAIYGADKRLNFFNSAFATLWGVEEDWLAGEPSLDELLERLRERRRVPEYADFRAFKRQQLDMFTSLIEPLSELMHLPDGRTLSTSVSPHPLGGLIFVYEDVTDRLTLERSYNTLIEVQRETLDNLFEGIAVFGSDGRLKLHNPAYRDVWDLSEAALEGGPHFTDVVEKTRYFYDNGVDWSGRREQIIERIMAQSHWTGRLDRRDGSVLQLATVPLPDGNVLVTSLDITDTIRVERALRERNEALETADRLKSEFIANFSYELRTPLNAIIGFAEILAHQYFGPLSPRQLDYARGILGSSHRLMALINDILDLATIEAGYMTLETEEVEIRAMLESVMHLSSERVRTQSLSLTMLCPDDIGALAADERRLKQALFNLISNAAKFTPPGGSIRLEAQIDHGDVMLIVADTGIGIPAADQARVFEKFERGDPQSRDIGSGLGLSLVKSLIELHGGSIAIESKPGEGTTILCRLPAKLRTVPPAG